MGLDMYLEKCNRMAWGFRSFDVDEVKESNPKLYKQIKPYLHQRGKYITWESIFEEVGYWRKANAIHKWFVENVQDGVDDCDYYEVTKEQLEELREICIRVRDYSKLEYGQIKNGEQIKDGEWVPIYVEGEYIVNPEMAKELLPTTDGFFFGSTEYDQWYLADIENTIAILTKALETTDFDLEIIAYNASW